MTFPTEAPAELGYGPGLARIRDCWLGGSHHSEQDRAVADHILVCAPQMPFLVRQRRSLQQRMVRYLVEHGVDQFLGFDAGVPTMGHIHEVARSLLPGARVVYIDNDPSLVELGRDLLDGDERTAYLHADARSAGHLLDHPELPGLIDLAEPVAIMMLDALQYIPDRDDPAILIAAYTGAMCSGSYLALSQFSQTQHLLNGLRPFSDLYGEPPAIPFREPEQLARLFTGLDLVEPGIVPVPLWHPDPGEDLSPHPERIRVYTGLGRKL